MTDILVDINCGENTCGECKGLDKKRSHCNIFDKPIDAKTGERCEECYDAEDAAWCESSW